MTKSPKSVKTAADAASPAKPAPAAKAAPKPAAKTAAPKPAAKPRAKPATALAKPAATAVVAMPKPLMAVVGAGAAAPKPKPGHAAKDDAPALRKKDFLARVLTMSGAKKKDAQVVMDATLKALGEALSKGESLALPGLGKARVSRQVDKTGGEMLVIKLRRGGEPKPGKGRKAADESLAEAED